MHFGAVCAFRLGPEASMPDLEALRAALAAALPGAPRLRQRLARRGWTRRPVWTPARDLRIEEHVRAAPAGADLRAVADDVLSRRLPRTRPLWAVWLVPAAPDERCFSLVIQVHHAVTDGIGAVRILETLLGTRAGAPPAPATSRARTARASRPRARGSWRPLLRLLRGFLRGGPATPLNGSVPPRRFHRWLTSDAAALDATAERLGAARNDVVLAAGASALRAALARTGAPPATVRAFCPVSLRRGARDGDTPGNQISLWLVDLPLRIPDRDALVAAIAAATGRHKRGADAAGGVGVARLAEALGAWVSWLGMAIAAQRRAYQVVITHLPGPARPLHLLGARLEALVPFAPLFPGQRLAIAVVRHDGRLHWGVCDGWPDAAPGERIAAGLRAFLDALPERTLPIPRRRGATVPAPAHAALQPLPAPAGTGSRRRLPG
jgi:hypothetical protein